MDEKIKEWKQLKVKTMWNGEKIAYEEAHEGEFILKSEHESEVSKRKDIVKNLLLSMKQEIKNNGGDCNCGGELPDGRSPDCALHESLWKHRRFLNE